MFAARENLVMSRPAARKLWRDPQGALVAGVCTGLAEHLRVGVVAVRVFFLALALLGGGGLLGYFALWLFVPRRRDRGRRWTGSLWPLGAMVAVIAGLFWLATGSRAAVPSLLMAIGGTVVWLQSDRADEGSPRWRRWRTAGGLALVGLGATVFVAWSVGWARTAQVVGMVAVILATLAVVLSPFLLGLLRDRDEERAARALARERADTAAHLHDSVLQTLTLIQRNSADPVAVTRLARAEERGLRQWLYGRAADDPAGAGFAALLQQAAAQVEQRHGKLVDVVTVGDIAGPELTEAIVAAVAAAREAMNNAAVHSGDPDPIRVFGQVGDDEVAVFVRDRGRGFDPSAVAMDRAGVRESILGRVARVGGSALVRSHPGGGTEVQIVAPRHPAGVGEGR